MDERQLAEVDSNMSNQTLARSGKCELAVGDVSHQQEMFVTKGKC